MLNLLAENCGHLSGHNQAIKRTGRIKVGQENLWFDHCNVTRVYDLKDCCGSDSSERNKVLSDQDLVGTMTIPPPIFVRRKCLMLLERAIWNDTAFLASIGIMDYSLLVGVEEEKQELVVGITGYLRRYARNEHSRTSEKGFLGFLRRYLGTLGGSSCKVSPSLVSPEEYKKQFRKATSSYFLLIFGKEGTSLRGPTPC